MLVPAGAFAQSASLSAATDTPCVSNDGSAPGDNESTTGVHSTASSPGSQSSSSTSQSAQESQPQSSDGRQTTIWQAQPLSTSSVTSSTCNFSNSGNANPASETFLEKRQKQLLKAGLTIPPEEADSSFQEASPVLPYASPAEASSHPAFPVTGYGAGVVTGYGSLKTSGYGASTVSGYQPDPSKISITGYAPDRAPADDGSSDETVLGGDTDKR